MMGSTSSFNMNHDSQSHCMKDKIQIIDSIDNEILEKEEEQGDDEKNSEGQDNNAATSTTNATLNDLQSCMKPHYGFLNMHHSIFTDYAREGIAHEMLENPNPDSHVHHHNRCNDTTTADTTDTMYYYYC